VTQAREASFEAGAGAQGERLDVFLSAQGLGLSRSQLKRLIDLARVSLNGAPAKPSARLRAGDQIRVVLPPPEPSEATAEEIPLTILHEDPHLVVLVKPAGMVVHPAAGVRSGTLVNALLAHCRDLAGVGGVLRPGIVHRLDKGTSGVMVVAKSDAAHAGLARQFKDHTASRRYLALVHGHPRPARGTIETLLGRDPRARVRFTARVREGRRAVTHYEVREELPATSLLALRLETGRTHQIRVHLSERGHPVVGDPLYGRRRLAGGVSDAAARAILVLDHQMLHAELLGFEHPVTGERLEFSAEIPEDFAALLALLRGEGTK
jgi:23S rRNA pseudouridine1911/1915/1917 synthase